MKIKINLHGNPMPECKGDWVDLYTAEEVEMKQLEYRLISLGVSMELPDGYEALVLPRSSTCGKYGILLGNSMGVIDNAYCGPADIWRFGAVALRDTVIPKGVRIAQFRLLKNCEPIEFVEDTLEGNLNRGGIGSTGTGKES